VCAGSTSSPRRRDQARHAVGSTACTTPARSGCRAPRRRSRRASFRGRFLGDNLRRRERAVAGQLGAVTEPDAAAQKLDVGHRFVAFPSAGLRIATQSLHCGHAAARSECTIQYSAVKRGRRRANGRGLSHLATKHLRRGRYQMTAFIVEIDGSTACQLHHLPIRPRPLRRSASTVHQACVDRRVGAPAWRRHDARRACGRLPPLDQLQQARACLQRFHGDLRIALNEIGSIRPKLRGRGAWVYGATAGPNRLRQRSEFGRQARRGRPLKRLSAK